MCSDKVQISAIDVHLAHHSEEYEVVKQCSPI